MPRSPRQDHEGAWQHVMNRGINRQAVFRSDVHSPQPGGGRLGSRAVPVAVVERAGLPRPRANAGVAAHRGDPGDARPARCAAEVSRASRRGDRHGDAGGPRRGRAMGSDPQGLTPRQCAFVALSPRVQRNAGSSAARGGSTLPLASRARARPSCCRAPASCRGPTGQLSPRRGRRCRGRRRGA